MAEATSRDRAPAEDPALRYGEADAELESAREEILRLRDLLIGKDAELGRAKGRLAELEEQQLRVAGVKSRIARLLPGVRMLLAAARRVMRGAR